MPTVKPLELTVEVVATLRSEAERAYPNECCGALLEDASGALLVRPLVNVAARPGAHFEVSARETLALERDAERAGQAVVAIYHSHPDGPDEPSEADLAAGRRTVIILVRRGVAGAPRVF